MRGTVFILMLFTLLPFTSADVFFSEVFPNPIADESLNEWVELVNNNSFEIDVKGWIFGDSTDNDTLEGGLYEGMGAIIPSFGIALITDDATRVYDNFDTPPHVVKLYVDDSSLGNGLGNTGETIFIYDGETLIDTVSYPKVGEGMSASLTKRGWVEGPPTPGFFNASFIHNPSFCDYELILEVDGSSFFPDDFEWRMRASNNHGEKTNLTGGALIVDAAGNVIKAYKPWTNKSITTQKTSPKYSPNLKGGSYILFANMTTTCEDENPNNNHAFHFFTIQEEKQEEQQNSELSILNILDLGSDKEAKFGQIIRARLEVYRGDTGKKSISLWVEHKGERITKQSKLSVEQKFTRATYTVPIFLPMNCDGKLEDGTYDVIVEGLGEEDDERLKVGGNTPSSCPKSKVSPLSRKGITFEIINLDGYSNDISGSSTIRLWNNEESTKKVEVWSYIYRGSKSYTGERKANKKTLTLQPHSVSDIQMENTPIIEEGGDFKIKFVFQQESRKTPDELTREIFVSKPQHQDQITTVATPQFPETENENAFAVARPLTMPKVAYESTSMKAKKVVPLLFLLLIIILTILIVWYAD